MKRARIGILATAVLAVATMAFAQAKADFSGSWAPEVDPAAAAPAGGGGGRGMGGGPMTVKQTATELTIERTAGENKITQTYKLDGTESKNAGRGGETVSTAKWDGPKLVITTKAGENETTQNWSLAGSVLTVESTSARGTQKRVYKKTT